MAKTSKSAFGSKENIELAKEVGYIDEYDILYLDNGEVAWVDRNDDIVINTPRTQKDIIAECVGDFDEISKNVISSGKTLDEITELITQAILPKMKEEILKSAADYTDGVSISGSPVQVIEF